MTLTPDLWGRTVVLPPGVVQTIVKDWLMTPNLKDKIISLKCENIWIELFINFFFFLWNSKFHVPDLSVWVSVTELLCALGGSAGMWDINRWSVSPPRPPLLASDTVGMEMLGMVNTLDTVANGDWVLVAESMTSWKSERGLHHCLSEVL